MNFIVSSKRGLGEVVVVGGGGGAGDMLVHVLIRPVSELHRFIAVAGGGGWGGGGWVGLWGGGVGPCVKYNHARPYKCKVVSTSCRFIVQELCESRGGRPGLSVLTSLLVSVDVKIYCTVLRHWSQLVPNMSHDI